MEHLLFADDLHPVEPGQHINISYTEVLELSYDVEKGRIRGPYGLPGDGLNFQLWKGRKK